MTPAHPFPERPLTCEPSGHAHCARCGIADATVYAAPTADGGRFPPLCSPCAVKVMRMRALEPRA